MSNHRQMEVKDSAVLSIHPAGRFDFEKHSDWRANLAADRFILDQRCEQFCKPLGITGRIVFRIRKRRLYRKLDRRWNPIYRIFNLENGRRLLSKTD